MIPELFPHYFTAGNPHTGKHDACKSASAIFAISERTKRDLLDLYPDLDGQRVVVTPLAVDTNFFRANARGEDDSSLLFVGSRHTYKNFSVFAEAAAILLSEDPSLRVVCVGGGPLLPDEIAPFRARNVDSRISQRNASDSELAGYYRRARAFVFPSLYEGFGLPILEAFACACPVVLSNASCFPEVAGDAGEYFDPTSADSLLEALRRVLGDAQYRAELRRRGTLRLSDFTWDETARRTANIYRSLT
jgi:glycosyltransferase involved in cell wall biosynthesis